MMIIHLTIKRILVGCLSITVLLLLAAGAFGAQEEKVIISYSSRDFSILPAHEDKPRHRLEKLNPRWFLRKAGCHGDDKVGGAAAALIEPRFFH